MTRSTGDAPTAVSESSETSGQAAPMSEAPKSPTKAQEASQRESGTAPAEDAPSTDVRQVAREDAAQREKHPDQIVAREANPNVGGESFGYLDVVDLPVLPTGVTEEEAAEEKKAAQKARKAAQDDENWRQDHPGRVRARKARAGVGGESFGYLDAIDQGEHPDNLPSESDDEDDE